MSRMAELQHRYRNALQREVDPPAPHLVEEWCDLLEQYLLVVGGNDLGWANAQTLLRRCLLLCSFPERVLPSDPQLLASTLERMVGESPTGTKLVCGDGVLLGLILGGHFLFLRSHAVGETLGVGPLPTRRRWSRRGPVAAKLHVLEAMSAEALLYGRGDPVPEDAVRVYRPREVFSFQQVPWDAELFVPPAAALSLSVEQFEAYRTLQADGTPSPRAVELAASLC